MNTVTLKVEADTKDAEASLERLAKLNERVRHRSGWKSTKLHLALIMMALVMFGWASLTEDRRAMTFDAMVFGLATAAGIFSTTRVAESFAARRNEKPTPAEPEVEP